MMNISVIANCLGSRQDLEDAIVDFSIGKYDVRIDSVYEGENVIPFFERTFQSNDRFGKVVYRYED